MSEWVALRDVADLNPENLGAGTAPNFEFRYIDLGSVSHGRIDWSATSRLAFRSAPSRARRVLREGDVLFGTVRPSLRSHARFGYSKDQCVASTGFVVVRARPGVSDPGFLTHYLLSDECAGQARRVEVGSNYPAVNERDVGQFRLPRLPLDEQQSIARVLDTVDETIDATERIIAKVEAAKAGMLRGRFAGFAATGRLVRLRDVAGFQVGIPFPSSEYQALGVALLRPGNIQNTEYVVWDDDHTVAMPSRWLGVAGRYVVPPGSIVMNLTAQSLEDGFLGRAAVTPQPVQSLLNQRVARFDVNGCDHDYFFWALRSPFVREQVDRLGQGTKVQHLYNKDVEALLLPLPPEREQQTSVASELWSFVASGRRTQVARPSTAGACRSRQRSAHKSRSIGSDVMDRELVEVEQPFGAQLASMDWTHLLGNKWDPAASERGSFREVLLVGRLRAALRNINLGPDGEPWLDDERISQAVSALATGPAGQKLIEANQEATELLLAGTTVAGLDDWDGGRDRTINFIDFEHPERNDFLR